MSESTLLARLPHGRAAAESSPYTLRLALDADEVLAAQRLRHQVFAEEMGAHVHSDGAGAETDPFDAYCDHLIVRHEPDGAVVGTYRMLPPQRAEAAGGLYSDAEFDLSALRALRSTLVETGRSCVHPDHRSGAVVSLVWAGIARYMHLHGHRWLAGCASVPLADGGRLAARVWDTARRRHLAADEHRVTPRLPWNPDDVTPAAKGTLPALLRGYLRLGARVCGPPAHDPEFGVADFFVLLDVERIDRRYLDRFLGSGA